MPTHAKDFFLDEKFLTSGSNSIEYRIKLFCSKTVIIAAQKTSVLKTNCITNLTEHFNILIKPFENLHGLMMMQNEGYIDYKYKGHIDLLYKNVTNDEIVIKAGETIGYLIVSHFTIQ